ncbi:MAG TPA: LD-carboxypeptidase [Acidobacteriaceae bacterium]|nr:LD-carboxypeptidase [Acidobacteriaceae bacterium]
MPDRPLKPPSVPPGAKIAVLSPASSAKSERITAGIEKLRALGYNPIASEHAYGKHPPYFSASVEDRLNDLHTAVKDPEVSAIICTRGGYGSNYLLPHLDLDLIRANPKPFFAYSDHTALQTWINDQTGLVAFHGPMAAADFSVENGVHLDSFHAALTGDLITLGPEQGIRTLKPGHAQGTLYGGCLSILTASLGTQFAPQTEGKLLFLEDVGTKPYQIDRMLRQMILAGKFEGVRGFIFGEMLDSASPGADPNLLEQVILRVLQNFNVPIAIGLRSGHVSHGNVTLPFGIEANLALDKDQSQLQTIEPAVSTGHAG